MHSIQGENGIEIIGPLYNIGGELFKDQRDNIVICLGMSGPQGQGSSTESGREAQLHDITARFKPRCNDFLLVVIDSFVQFPALRVGHAIWASFLGRVRGQTSSISSATPGPPDPTLSLLSFGFLLLCVCFLLVGSLLT